MADLDAEDTDTFTFDESVIVTQNGDILGSTFADSDQFTFRERAYISKAVFDYLPPYDAIPVNQIYTVSFYGLLGSGYEWSAGELFFTEGAEYPLIRAQVFDAGGLPVNLSANGLDIITFNVQCNDGTFISRTCSVVANDTGEISFSMSNVLPIGDSVARFTGWDDQTTDIPLISFPTQPITVHVLEV